MHCRHLLSLLAGVLFRAQGSQRLWKLEVPPGQSMLWFATGDGQGTTSMRVKLGGRPLGSGSNPDCSGSAIDGGQQCLILNPAAGT